MKKNRKDILFSEIDKMPISYHVWHISDCDIEKLYETTNSIDFISEVHNTDYYNLQSLYKPISSIIDFKINEGY